MSSWNRHSHINHHKTYNLNPHLPDLVLPDSIKSFVINLKINPDRLRFVDRQLKRVKIKYQRYEAIYGKELDIDKLVEDKTIVPDLKEKAKLHRGSIGCYLSHVDVWKKILDDPDCQIGLIFEDDAIIMNNIIPSIYDALNSVPADWDLLYLGSYKLRGKNIKNKFIKPVVGNLKGHNSGMFGYLINKRSIPKLLNVLLPIQYQTKDPWIRTNFDKINAYFLINKCVKPSYAFKSMRTAQ